jgi:16S rRNA (adenine1518-N6/adenine1519-N6)-dimethyltransferase
MEYRPKRRFGQNFLRDVHILDKILAAAALNPTDQVLEIGPGMGALTDRMLPQVREVHVIEIDRDLAARLRQRDEPKLRIHEGDALELDWSHLLGGEPSKMVANLPYNISSQILFKVLDHIFLFQRLVLMFQKEVGDRLCAVPGTKDYGILSVFCQLHFDIRRVAVVPPGAFSPPPKVQSVVLVFDRLSRPRVAVEDENFFRRVVKAAFGQRRKTLRNALAGAGFGVPAVEAALLQADIDPGRRGETLTLAEFAKAARTLRDHMGENHES